MPETVAVHHPRDPTRPTLIPSDRYDPDRHRIWNPDPTEEPHGDPTSTPEREAERPGKEEGERTDQEVGGLPDGYWAERSGSWFTVFAADGTVVDKVQGRASAVSAARAHMRGDRAHD